MQNFQSNSHAEMNFQKHNGNKISYWISDGNRLQKENQDKKIILFLFIKNCSLKQNNKNIMVETKNGMGQKLFKS